MKRFLLNYDRQNLPLTSGLGRIDLPSAARSTPCILWRHVADCERRVTSTCFCRCRALLLPVGMWRTCIFESEIISASWVNSTYILYTFQSNLSRRKEELRKLSTGPFRTYFSCILKSWWLVPDKRPPDWNFRPQSYELKCIKMTGEYQSWATDENLVSNLVSN